MGSTGNAADTDFISNYSLAEKTGALRGCLEKKILVFFLGGREKNPPRLAFQLVEIATSFLVSHFLPLSAHVVYGALTKPDSTLEEETQKNGPEKASNS